MNITQQIIENPKGGTVSLEGHELPVTGYFVGGIVSSLIIDEDALAADAQDNIGTFVDYLTDTVAADYVGWWTDEDTGALYVDGTTWHETEFEAGKVGRERHEIAIYDIARERELRLAYVEGE